MTSALFDTSVLVPALVDQLSNHPVAFQAFMKHSEGQETGYCSTHALAECYSVLTALPLPKRILPYEANRLIEETVQARLEIVELSTADYTDAILRVSELGFGSGRVYDALHVAAAEKAECKLIYTYNIAHFEALCFGRIAVTAP